MTKKLLYLKEDVYIEPLFNNWYIWPHLISPATAARHIEKNHKRIMGSFVKNAHLHVIAAKQSTFSGGDFLNQDIDKVENIQSLLDSIDNDCAELLELSEAIAQLEETLRSHTSGLSIEPLYARIPPPLKGLIELFLDMEHRASYRLIEPLVYNRYYNPALQSLSFGLLTDADERPFIMSTPRLPDENHLHAKTDFNSPLMDLIALSRTEAIEEKKLIAAFDSVTLEGGLNYLDLFTDIAPKNTPPPLPTSEVRLRYLGHAGFLIESSEVSILVDPLIPTRGKFCESDVISYSELPDKIDYICLTHCHSDHISLETLLQLRHKTGRIIVPKNNGGTLNDPSMRLILKTLNFDVTEVDDLEDINIPQGCITSIPFLGEHGDLNVRSKTAWCIELNNKKMFFGADSSNPDISLYETLGDMFSNIDIFAIGMECVGAPYTWSYGALHTLPVSKEIKESRRLNGSDSEQAFKMAQCFNPKQIFIYALGLEPWYKYLMGIEYSDDSMQIIESNKMVELCKEINIPIEILYGKKTITLT